MCVRLCVCVSEREKRRGREKQRGRERFPHSVVLAHTNEEDFSERRQQRAAAVVPVSCTASLFGVSVFSPLFQLRVSEWHMADELVSMCTQSDLQGFV